ncbi:MAG: DUF1036 domain-containing protein [Chitinophagaceae bacterium]
MKYTLLFLTLILSAFISRAQEINEPPPPLQEKKEIERRDLIENSRTNLTIRNNTNKTVYVSYVAYDANEESWTSHGWYTIMPYKVITLPLGDYKGAVYLHAKDDIHVWGDKWNFCIDKKNAFEIVNADKVKCISQAKFWKMQVVPDQVNKWNINLR